MFAAAIAFGVTAGVSIVPVLLRPAPAVPAAVAATVAPPVAAPPAVLPTATAATTAVANETAEPAVTAAPVAGRPSTPKAAASPAAATAPGRSLDLHSITQGAPNITPTDEPGGSNEGPKAAGQCLSQGQILQVYGLHQAALRRVCWDRNPTSKLTVSVSADMTIGPDGVPQSVSASGDEPSVSKCIENEVRTWRFPAMGCTQKATVPFKLVRQ
jgi:hypothetical protein